MKNVPLILILLLAAAPLWSQKYGTAAGMRLGTDWGLTVQQRIAPTMTIEAIAQSSLQREEFLLTVMAEKHNSVLGRRFNLYFGGGLHKGWINESSDEGIAYKDPFGITAIGGLEFSLGRLNLSYDLKPAINIVGGENNFYTQSGISLRYVFITDKELGGNKRKKRGKGLGGFLDGIFKK